MVFSNRNKEYGAYKLREQTGARYRRVLTIILGTLACVGIIHGGTALYLHIMAARNMKAA